MNAWVGLGRVLEGLPHSCKFKDVKICHYFDPQEDLLGPLALVWKADLDSIPVPDVQPCP